jgi:class 3 adenylate cyclase/CheY-like chemotaxis protein
MKVFWFPAFAGRAVWTGGTLSTKVPDERLNRALTVFLRQEVQAPATAVTDFLDMIIEDARSSQPESMLADLNRMRGASVQLNEFVKSLIQDSSANRQKVETPDAFRRRLRHDLRTPLNAIKGYSELLIEDMDADENHPLRQDLVKLKESADQLLGQIETMAALARREEAGLAIDSKALKLDLVADVLRTVEPLPAGGAGEAVLSSRILIVDDNAPNRDVLERRLAREGHQVKTVANGAGGLELVGNEAFDLILLDLIMPEMSGFEVLRRLKAAEHTSHIPVIVISALDELDSVVRCIEAGAEDYLTKPFNPTLLRARIGASLEKKWLRDREKKFVADLEQEKARSETLLLNILPQSIVDRMRNGEMVIADSVSEATILFCDLVGFTRLSAKLSAGSMIDVLSKIFSSFDRLVAERGVEKIKTIGDAYMVAAGIPEAQSDHADRIAALAPRMLEAVSAIAETTGLKLEARIGIHTGPITAGVIGTHKFVYDVWGDTVNTASRMESHSLPGRIQISAATRAALGDRFKLERRGIIEIKGKGMMETYFFTDV